MNVRSIIDMLHKGAEWVSDLGPAATIIGGPMLATAVKAVSTVTAVATNVLDRIEDGKIVATSNDADEIKTIIAKIAFANDALNEAIKKS